jgi:hypothetical protein
MSLKCKAPSSSTDIPGKGYKNVHKCPNQLCQHTFAQERNVKIHLAKTKPCTDALFRTGNTNDGSLDVPSDHNANDTNFEPDNDFDETATMPWLSLQPWGSTSEEASNSSSVDDIDMEDEGDDDNLTIDPSITPELVTAHGLCFTQSDYAETKLLKSQ